MLQLIEQKNINPELLYSEMEKQFPKNELKTKDIFAKVLNNKNYKVFFIMDGEVFCGYFTFLEFPDNTILLEYFAINKEFHNKGYGSETFKIMQKTFKYKGCYLEVEKKNPDKINTLRRVLFYENLGAKKLDINYLYPNILGILPMDLYFMPYGSNEYFPKKSEILANIETAFENIHFDIDNRANILAQMC